MKLVSGCMITKNEGEYLEYSIRSFIDYVDELIIIDDFSTDETVDIILTLDREYPNKITLYQDVYCGNKFKQRNEYLKHATGEWIFCPDGDEVYFPEQMERLRGFWSNNTGEIFIGFRLLNFWKHYRLRIRGDMWDQIMQRTFKNLSGIGYYDRHHSVSLRPGDILAKVAQETNRAIYLNDMFVPHYSMTKNARQIMGKLEYYMRRDNPNCKNVEDYRAWARKHPYFSEDYSNWRYGEKGLYCCGRVRNKIDKVEIYSGPHPEIIKRHPNWRRLYSYVLGMNHYMESHWQFHNHLDHEKHQNRIKYTSEFCFKNTLEVGCANGFSTLTMQEHCKEIGKNTVFSGVEATDWGFAMTKSVAPGLKFYKFMGENMPFDDGEFDTVLLPEIIEHCLDPRALADEAWRISKHRMIITTPTQAHPDPDHRRFFMIDQMREFLKPYGVVKFAGLTKDGQRTENLNDIYFQIAVVDKNG